MMVDEGMRVERGSAPNNAEEDYFFELFERGGILMLPSARLTAYHAAILRKTSDTAESKTW